MWIFLLPQWARNVQEKPRCRPHSTTVYTIGARGAKLGLIADATWSFYILVTLSLRFEIQDHCISVPQNVHKKFRFPTLYLKWP